MDILVKKVSTDIDNIRRRPGGTGRWRTSFPTRNTKATPACRNATQWISFPRNERRTKGKCRSSIDTEMEAVSDEMEVTAGMIQKLADENATRKLDQHDYCKKYDGYASRYAALESRMDSLDKKSVRGWSVWKFAKD